MSAQRALFIFGLLSLLPFALLFADQAAEPSIPSDCPGRPSHATPVEYRIVSAQRSASPKRIATGPQLEADTTKSPGLRGRQQLRNEDEYQDVFGTHSSGIDWSNSRIVVVPLSTVYKSDKLDSTVTFAGISQTADAIYIGMTFTQIGPCQGIAHKAESFHRDQVNYFVLLPTRPERIVFYTCVVNGCPPDIP
jgi:hypothetical protein